MILDDLRRQIDQALSPWAKRRGLDRFPVYTLEEPPGGMEADVACNLALVAAKPLNTSPRAIAEELLPVMKASCGMAEEVSIAGAGFLNFRWSGPRLRQEIGTVLKEGPRYGRESEKAPEKILIEFVSANPTGPLHVGHGRGAALGDSLALILAHLGHTVSREYYVNDAGNQVQVLGESLLARCAELEGNSVTFPENGYHGEYVKDLAKEWLGKSGPRTLESAMAFAVERILKLIEKDLADFGVRFDSWFREASLIQGGLLDKHVAELKKRGFVEEMEGALWFVAPKTSSPAAVSGGSMAPPPTGGGVDSPPEAGGNDDPYRDKNRVLRRRDGRWTYFATDVAYHADKYERGYDRLINVWGADHHGYVSRVKGSMQALGYDPGRLHIILNQLVSLTRSGVPVSMSKRSGDFITLREVLEEVGRDACRFFFALRGPNTALDFDLELAKRQTVDNPVYYLQYAHARICSIFRQAPPSPGLRPPSPLSRERDEAQVRSDSPLHTQGRGVGGEGVDLTLLKEKEERDLMKRLALFPQALRTCAQEDSPHPLANYLLLLGRQFHYFYDHHRVLGEDPKLTGARLGLLEAVRQVLRLGLGLLGVSAPETM